MWVCSWACPVSGMVFPNTRLERALGLCAVLCSAITASSPKTDMLRTRPPHPHAQVYLATWKGTPVAVKVLDDDQGDALATLGSPVLDKLRAVRGGGEERGQLKMRLGGVVPAFNHELSRPQFRADMGCDSNCTPAENDLVPTHWHAAQEAGVMASMRHPNIVSFMGVCTAPPAIVTEYCERGSLTSLLQAAKALPELAAELTWRFRIKMVRERGGTA